MCRRAISLAAVCLLLLSFISGCSPPEGGAAKPETPTPSPELTYPIPTRPDFEGEAGSIYTPEQRQRITTGDFASQENTYIEWLKYWSAAEDNNAFVLLQAGGEYQGRTFALPIKNGQFMMMPPATPKGEFTIPEGFGPLELTGSVAFRNGDIVRLDDRGEIAERLNMESAQWVREIAINPDWKSPESFSTITLEDFTSGRLQEIESKWIEKHSPFSGKEILSDKIIIVRDSWGYDTLAINVNNRVLVEGYLADRSTFPAKIISYYKMQFPKDFFPHPENSEKERDFNNYEYFLVSQTWLNPDGSNTTLYYLYLNSPFISLPNNEYNRVPFPVYRVLKLTELDDLKMEFLYNFYEKNYANNAESPTPYLQKWLETGYLPKELENFIFPFNDFPI